jgi:RimJ/RimL family protein N-acetyltransferase
VHLRPDYWRRGLAEEAAGAVIDFAFAKVGATELFAGHHPENERLLRLLTKLGFRFTHEEWYAPTTRVHPSYLLVRGFTHAATRALTLNNNNKEGGLRLIGVGQGGARGSRRYS